MLHDQRTISSSRAFTLVELLVVIGIIAILIGILLPTVVRARQSAQALTCATRLRSLGQVLMLHANDHTGYLPLAGNIAPGPTGNDLDTPESLGDSARQRYDYYTNDGGNICVTALPAALSKYLGSVPARDDSWQNVDADIQATGVLQNAFLCPSDGMSIDRSYGAPRWINNYGSGTFLNGWSSYGVNAEIFAWTDAGVGGTAGHSRARGKLSSVPHSDQTMLMCDTNQAIEVWVLGPQLSLGDVYLETGGTVGHGVFDLTRHRGAMNILYADGHVDSQIILKSLATWATGTLGSAGNSPSEALMAVSMHKDFR